MTAVKAFRGAIQVEQDEPVEVRARVATLVSEVLERNRIELDDLISIILTATPDLVSCFPASAVRELGIHDVPLLGAQEMALDGAPPRVVRVMVHAESALARAEIHHVYLGGAAALRPDLCPGPRPHR